MSGHILHVHPAQPQTTSVPEQQYQLYLSMKVDPQLQQQDIAIWLALQMKFETLQKTSEYEAYVTGESSGQVNEKEQDDDEILTKQVLQDIMEEVSLTINEAELKKIADEMLRQRCSSGDEHQYHIDQMKNFLKSDIVWESRKEILASPHPRKTTPLVQSCQIDPEAPALWVNKCVKKFNPYAWYGVEHWKNSHAKICLYKETKKSLKTKEIVARRANECIVSITKPDYKNLNKNDIEDMYLLIMNGKVPDYAETGLLCYNNDVKYGYVQRELTNDEVEYLKLFEEEIEVRLKYRNQMRRWEMYVNGRPLGPRREHPE
ncbi:hypothetical protein Tco_0155504 [Tanacetum coccineum]